MTPTLPPLLLGLIVGAYWLRVLKLVLKTRRRSGRAANFLPPEPLGRALRLLWYPTVLLWIVLPFFYAFTQHSALSTQHYFSWPALLLAAACLAATWICWKRMGSSWRMGIDPTEKTRLVVSGPYAYVRHPIYALSSLLMLASLVIVPTVLMLIVAIVHLAFLQWEARREEQYLLELHGPAYADYRRHVGRFVPRSLHPHFLTPRNDA